MWRETTHNSNKILWRIRSKTDFVRDICYMIFLLAKSLWVFEYLGGQIDIFNKILLSLRFKGQLHKLSLSATFNGLDFHTNFVLVFPLLNVKHANCAVEKKRINFKKSRKFPFNVGERKKILSTFFSLPISDVLKWHPIDSFCRKWHFLKKKSSILESGKFTKKSAPPIKWQLKISRRHHDLFQAPFLKSGNSNIAHRFFFPLPLQNPRSIFFFCRGESIKSYLVKNHSIKVENFRHLVLLFFFRKKTLVSRLFQENQIGLDLIISKLDKN